MEATNNRRIYLTNIHNTPQSYPVNQYSILKKYPLNIDQGEVIAIDESIQLNYRFLGKIPWHFKKYINIGLFNAKSETYLEEEATVLENLQYISRKLELPHTTSQQRFEQLCMYFIFLNTKQHTKVSQLQKLERNLLALCVELLKQPDLLILDEPCEKMNIQDIEVFYQIISHLKRDAKSPLQNMSILLNEQTHIYYSFELADAWQYVEDGELKKVRNFIPFEI